MRRDQIWFVEKDSENATRLYPLSDYKARKGEALQKGYLNGRHGGCFAVSRRIGTLMGTDNLFHMKKERRFLPLGRCQAMKEPDNVILIWPAPAGTVGILR